MPDFRYTFYLSSPSGGKWSDVFYRASSDLDQASLTMSSFLNRRCELLHSLNSIKKVRISQVDKPRVSTIKQINRGGANNDGGPAATSWAIVCNIGSTAVPSSRRWWCRGFPQVVAFRDPASGVDVILPGYLESLRSFFVMLQKDSWQIEPIQRVGVGGVNPVRIINVDGTFGNGITVLTTKLPHNLVQNDICIIQQMNKKDFPALNGRFKVLDAPTATTLDVQYRVAGNLNIPAVVGQVKKLVYVTGAIVNANSCGFSFIGERKSKNDLTGSRGARSAQRVRNLA
jgi:hypothetical protein